MLLGVSNISKSFGVDIILSGLTFQIGAREKVALVGRNGTGKTTLLRILTDQEYKDGGNVQLARGAKIGYLRQEAPVDEGGTVLQEAEGAVAHKLEMRERLTELEQRLEQGPSDEDLEEYARIHEHFVQDGGYSVERDVRVVLARMGFTEEEYGKSTSELSGGEKTRLAIARLLLEEPDLLILDEPTNHLDLQATEWLEGWIRTYPGAVLLVSHDRTFLENTAERVLELRDTHLKSYPGDFRQFLKLRAEEEAMLADLAAKQEQEIAKLDEYVRRFMNSQRTAQARGRQKLMERLLEDRVVAPKADKSMKLGCGKAKRSGDNVIVAEELGVGYGEQALFSGLDWTVCWGERWGVIGENGSGKSTLLKTAMGLLEPVSGKVRLGSNVQVGYFAQDVADLDQDISPLQYMVWEVGLDPGPARDLLGRFLMSGDDVYRPIRSLSGGEKNKLSLAHLTYLSPNLLVLDEPTNHLDMDSREALAKVLKEYTGTLVLISHDRWLLSQVTERTLDVRRAGAIVFPGSYTDYRLHTERKNKAQSKSRQEPKRKEPEPDAKLSPRELSKEIQRVQRVVDELEELVTQDELAIKRCEAKLANLPPHADVLSLIKEHESLKETLAGRLAAWEEQTLKLEELRAEQSSFSKAD